MDIGYRSAVSADSETIAQLICVAGGGLYEFLFDGLIPLLTAADVLARAVSSERETISYRNCVVAFSLTSGEVFGAANAFPVDELKEERYRLLPTGRREHIRSMLQMQDWGSMFLNAIVVGERCRRNGVGSQLVDWSEIRAREAGLDRLSLHVWADNTAALKFFRAKGFVALRVAAVAPHPRLPHLGGSILMSKPVLPREGAK